MSYIREKYPILRQKNKFEMGRYSEMYATMILTANLITDFARERHYWGEMEANEFLTRIENILLSELRNMEHRIRRRDKGVLVIDVFLEALKNHKIVPVVLNKESCARREAFYEDEGFYYIQTKELRKVVNIYCKTYHESIEIINEDELIGLLEKQGILDILEQDGNRQRSRKLPIQHGNTYRYLYISKKAIGKLER